MVRLKKHVQQQWRASPRLARLRCFDNILPSREFVKFAVRAPRRLAAILIQLRTGHCILNKHLYRIKKSDTPLCP
jgi:hypothetical protein